ncbi:hypothetical protein SADUNF_Sadunf13G0006200 [Salix dunnii]|uniref:Serine hydrolase domain-containing protein n=1 Tax=Salix dunnii TaxID=1413687 RepID=A0A835JK27_9ROSI|nr:hypothetical protein SADUNF_Sadunf13G0006200 [Salix dunnii]
MIRLLMNVVSLLSLFVLSSYESLSYKPVELVTFSPYPLAKAPDVSNAGRHLSAAEFHSVLQNAGELRFPFWFFLFALPFGLLSFYCSCLSFFVTFWKLVDTESVADDKGLVLLQEIYIRQESGSLTRQMWTLWIQESGSIASAYIRSKVLDLKMYFRYYPLASTARNVRLGVRLRSPIKLRISCLHGFHQNASGFKGRTASLSRKLKSIVELIFVDAPLELSFIYQPVVSELECSDESSLSSQQFLPSIAMVNVSLSYLKTVFSQDGPFDGILGFSLGEAIKGDIDFRFAILCAGFGSSTSRD